VANLPLWQQTEQLLAELIGSSAQPADAAAPVFCSANGQQSLTRFGIYKIVRRHAATLDDPRTGRTVSPTSSGTPRPSTYSSQVSRST
jgi:hypothetical protein